MSPFLGRTAGLILCTLLCWGCAVATSYIEPENDEPADLFRSSTAFSSDAGPQNVILQSDNDWEQLLSSYAVERPDSLRELFYRVDFSRHMVIGVILGSRFSGSVTVRIDSVAVQRENLVVFASEHHPASQTGEWSNPAHFVVVPRTHRRVEFAEIEVDVEDGA